MQHTDISIIEQIFAARNFGDNEAAESLLKGLSPEIRTCFEAYLPGRCSSDCPPVVAAWDDFYKSKWSESLSLFTSALSDKPWQALAALGIGRIATRWGEWAVARQWLLYAMLESRHKYNDFLLMQCHGAMGELMLRTQHYHESLQHMQLAYALCPAGHPQRQRQYSYIGMPLARLGKCQIAEGYYMSAYYLAIDQHDSISAMHALSRRAALVLYDYDVDLDDVKKSLFALSQDVDLKQYGSRIPLDYFNVVSFWSQWKHTDDKEMTLLENLFGGAPWESRVIAAVCGSSCIDPQLNFPPVTSDFNPIHLRNIIIEDACIVNKLETAEQLQNCLKTFFI
ncbi:MAG: hypothetical protein Q9N67_11475 [Ghiorsea sp.]|nr:hypothetical protein [Ghiorsea sp.]